MVSWEKFRKQKEFSHTKVRLKVVSRQPGAAQPSMAAALLITSVTVELSL